MIFGFENRRVFTPCPLRQEEYDQLDQTGLKVEEAYIPAPGGVLLHAWFCPHPEATQSIVYSHGNTGNISHRIPVLQLFHKLKTNIFLYDYRGYGKSTGKPNERGVYDDVRVASSWLASRLGCTPQDLIMAGRSLGGAVAVHQAATHGAKALILECTFNSMRDVAALRFPYLPVGLILRTRMYSEKKIRDFHGPILQVHGDADQTIPLNLGQRLFHAANQPKRFVLAAKGTHHDVYTQEYLTELEGFLKKIGDGTPSP